MNIMRLPIAIVAGALLIAASILIVGRYSIGHVGVGRDSFEVFGVDTWTGQPFMRRSSTK
jgi:hypothetical protein